MKISEKEQREIIEDCESKNFIHLERRVSGFDFYGFPLTLVVCEHKRNKKLYGFLCGENTEEYVYGYPEIFELSAKPITKIEYSRKDGKEIF